MLARKFKIRSRLRIEHILKKGFLISGKFFKIKYLPCFRKEMKPQMPDNQNFTNRYCAIASTKLSKSAAERNFVRRRVYEAVRRNWEKFEASFRKAKKTCYDIVIICTYKILKAEYREIEKELIDSYQKL